MAKNDYDWGKFKFCINYFFPSFWTHIHSIFFFKSKSTLFKMTPRNVVDVRFGTPDHIDCRTYEFVKL